jgi:hypothetical protein
VQSKRNRDPSDGEFNESQYIDIPPQPDAPLPPVTQMRRVSTSGDGRYTWEEYVDPVDQWEYEEAQRKYSEAAQQCQIAIEAERYRVASGKNVPNPELCAEFRLQIRGLAYRNY